MRIAAILREKGAHIESIEASRPLYQAASQMRRRRVGCLLVFNEARSIEGLLSERDVVAAMATHSATASDLSVASAMRRDVPVCYETDALETAMTTMTERRARHLPVLDGDTIVGVVSIGDLVKARLQELEHEAKIVHEYVTWGR